MCVHLVPDCITRGASPCTLTAGPNAETRFAAEKEVSFAGRLHEETRKKTKTKNKKPQKYFSENKVLSLDGLLGKGGGSVT